MIIRIPTRFGTSPNTSSEFLVTNQSQNAITEYFRHSVIPEAWIRHTARATRCHKVLRRGRGVSQAWAQRWACGIQTWRARALHSPPERAVHTAERLALRRLPREPAARPPDYFRCQKSRIPNSHLDRRMFLPHPSRSHTRRRIRELVTAGAPRERRQVHRSMDRCPLGVNAAETIPCHSITTSMTHSRFDFYI
jgi:hypothetical protein